MNNFFDGIKNLFPRARAFELFVDNSKRKLIKGLTVIQKEIRNDVELVYGDLFPDTTRALKKWENIFGIYFVEEDEAMRREVLDTMWKMNIGGQSALFLEDMLRKINDDIRVVENVPLRNINMNIVQSNVCDNRVSVCGNKRASCDYKIRNPLDDETIIMLCDSEIAVCDNEKCVCDYRTGEELTDLIVLQNNTSCRAAIPDNSRYWEFCVFVCKSAIRDERNYIVYIEWIAIEKNGKIILNI